MPPKRIASGPRSYHDLAWTWPNVSPPEDYVEEAEEHWVALERHARVPLRTLLHLGCGGGHLDATLKARFEVTGVDASRAMLGLARRLNPDVSYVCGDMRTVRLGRPFDAVAVFDSIGYMATREDLRAAFDTAAEHLRPDGVFLTYAEETKERFDSGRTRVHSASKDGTSIVFVEAVFDPDPRDTEIEAVFVYIIRRGRRIRVETDRHRMGLFPRRAWLQDLRGAGFRVRVVPSRRPTEEGGDVPWFVGVKRGP